MSIEVRQAASREGSDWWRWSVWLEGPDQELDQIQHVEYTLHPTFPRPVRRVRDRSTNFRLDESGWGEFMVYLKIVGKKGEVRAREHWLRLRSAAERRPEVASEAGERPRLFLSYGITDLPFARALTEALTQKGIDVLTPDDEPSDVPWEASLNALLSQANHAVFVVSRPTNWTTLEAELALKHGVPLTVVALGADPEIPPLLRNIPEMRVKARPDEARAVAREIARSTSRGKAEPAE